MTAMNSYSSGALDLHPVNETEEEGSRVPGALCGSSHNARCNVADCLDLEQLVHQSVCSTVNCWHQLTSCLSDVEAHVGHS